MSLGIEMCPVGALLSLEWNARESPQPRETVWTNEDYQGQHQCEDLYINTTSGPYVRMSLCRMLCVCVFR